MEKRRKRIRTCMDLDCKISNVRLKNMRERASISARMGCFRFIFCCRLRIVVSVKNSPPENKRKEGDAMMTYTEFYQFCILIVSLVNLFYQIYKDKRK